MTAPDHPRSRGVYARLAMAATSPWGSSPLARGLRGHSRHKGCDRGIIPARAGFTPPHAGPRSSSPDHPRSRGVYMGPNLRKSWKAGSSPLARGLPGRCTTGRTGGGIIPARAGFTLSTSACWRGRGDHPRSRGVYADRPPDAREPLGSSPLARGLPASGWTRSHGALDHPRSRGVYPGCALLVSDTAGSSPLARGLHRRAAGQRRRRGIIPARAGFTWGRASPCWRWPDHPRSRGVYAEERANGRGWKGSSPLARGLPIGRRGSGRAAGIIPARAGFTAPGGEVPDDEGDHPRSRGVYWPAGSGTPEAEGSSPLARGLRLAILGIPTITHPTRRLPPSLLT